MSAKHTVFVNRVNGTLVTKSKPHKNPKSEERPNYSTIRLIKNDAEEERTYWA